MDSNKQHTLDIFEKLKGQHILINNKVLRFIGIGEDDDDYLYILWNGREISYHTILERLTQLKGKIDDDDYNEIVRISKLNHSDSTNLWMPKTEELKELCLKNSINCKSQALIEIAKREVILLAELCWDIK